MKSEGVPKNQKPGLKIILVGNSGVGKTCLISSFFKKPINENSIPTVAPAYSVTDIKRSDGVILQVQLWDTAGQERYHSVSRLFFRDSDVALLCCELGDNESTDAIPSWINRVYEEAPTCKLFIVLTKADLKQQNQIENLKKDINEKFKNIKTYGTFVTSSITRQGVQEVFVAAADLITINENNKINNKELVVQSEKKCC